MSAHLCRVCGTEQPAGEATFAAPAGPSEADLAAAVERIGAVEGLLAAERGKTAALEAAILERDEKIAALEEQLTSPPAEPKADAPAPADAKSEAPAAAPAKQKNKGG